MACAGLLAEVARRKAMAPADFDRDAHLAAYGIDSMDAINLLGRVQAAFGVALQTLDGRTIWELSGEIVKAVCAAAEGEFNAR